MNQVSEACTRVKQDGQFITHTQRMQTIIIYLAQYIAGHHIFSHLFIDLHSQVEDFCL
jgi:hypothetical protein